MVGVGNDTRHLESPVEIEDPSQCHVRQVVPSFLRVQALGFASVVDEAQKVWLSEVSSR